MQKRKIDKIENKLKNPKKTSPKLQLDIFAQLREWTFALAQAYSLSDAWNKRLTNPTLNTYFKYFCRLHEKNFDKLSANMSIPKSLGRFWKEFAEKKDEKINSPVNEIITNEKETIEENGKTIKQVNKIVQKKISSISFSSPSTINTLNRINKSTEFKDLYMRDFLYYHSGGKEDLEDLGNGTKRKRFREHLNHIPLSRKIKEDLKELYKDLKNTTCPDEIKAITKRIEALNLLTESVTKIEMQPFDFFQKLADDDFSSQKAIHGAIINDQQMINNGNIEMKEGKDKVIKANTDEDLKRINSALMDKHLKNIMLDPQNTVIIDAE